MQSSYFCLVACAACIVGIGSHACAIQDSSLEDSSVLENLKGYDSVFESGLTVSGTRNSRDLIRRRLRLYLEVNRRWRLTFGGDRVGYMMEVIDYETPKYQRPGSPRSKQPEQLGRQGQDADETLRIAVRTRQWGYWGHDLSGNHYEDTVIAVTPAGEVTEAEKMYNSSLFGPRDNGPVAPRNAFFWSLGRFFSRHLDEVTRVETSEDGRLAISALGRKSDYQEGRWELEIEPAAAWMVRKARFYWDIEPDSVNVEMTNEGTVWSGPYCIPREAVVNPWGSIEGVETERLVFEPVVEKFDEQLYSSTQQAVANNRTPSLTLHDYRVSPPVISEPFRPKRTEPLPEGPASAMKWFLVANLVVIFGLLMLVIFWWRQRRRSGGDGK